MKRNEIEFVIGPDGSIVSTIKGIKGGSCKNIADAFKTLGKVISENRTSEFFENEGRTSVAIHSDINPLHK